MDEILEKIIVVFLYILFILLIPVIMLAATPIIFLYPGKKLKDGTRAEKNIKGRYGRIWKIWEDIGRGLPTS